VWDTAPCSVINVAIDDASIEPGAMNMGADSRAGISLFSEAIELRRGFACDPKRTALMSEPEPSQVDSCEWITTYPTGSAGDWPCFRAKGHAMAKNTICVWYDKDAEAAARFYAETFPDSAVGAIWRAPGDYPSGKKGDVLVVEFKVAGVSCIGLNGGPAFKHSEAFSFVIATDDQAETDRYWNAIVGNGGQESACGWCKDKWGVSWQITPRVLTEAMAAGGDEAKRAFEAMMTMKKIDVAAIEAARRG
jgi:predicted 3-demethylubiquinone-9 3-methyltransferase (glyoxalase superfamily)